MQYYEVLVADGSYKGSQALTYSYFEALPIGQVVEVPLKQKRVLGVISRRVGKPSFATKPLSAPNSLPPIPEQLIQLAVWITAFYPAGMGVTMQQFLPSKLYKSSDLPAANPDGSLQNSATGITDLPTLTGEQQQALQKMMQPGQELLQADSYLLHGETGSGKTRLYIELATKALAAGRSAIVLTPEIGLTPQLTQNFVKAFGTAQVITTHSKLTAKERNLAWLRILLATANEQPLVVLGPRSALFAPLHNLGLIILDESHEGSYKQEQAPHYHASKVAAKLASLHQAALVLGSATPAITDYHLAQVRQKPIIRLNARAIQSETETSIQLIDLKDRAQFARQPHLSKALLDSIATSMQHGEQSLVFLNRRGTARVILCENCGWQALCPHCDLPLTYHGDVHNVRCHTCGFSQPAPNSCPECGSANIILKSIGTKAIVDELQRVFPTARIQRFDTDNAKDERLEVHYDDVRAGKVDIIVGTQLIAKGLDLPRLSTVGVVVADTSLYLPDYTAGERSYQLLRQVIGRVGRGHLADARVIIQTYDPASPVIQAAAKGDWEGFYAAEIAERQAFMFPPFCHTMKIWCRRATPKAAQAAAEKVVAELRTSGLRLIIDGPTPAFYEKIAGKYQWQATIKAKDRSQLILAIKQLPANWSYDIDPSNLL
jgi:primosomal protein N' (replication factor Y)